jgi:hypothetical protein
LLILQRVLTRQAGVAALPTDVPVALQLAHLHLNAYDAARALPACAPPSEPPQRRISEDMSLQVRARPAEHFLR